MTETTTTTTTFSPNDEIQKLFNSLEPDETDINKIADVTHKCLLIMSVRDAALIINNKTDSDDEEEKMKLFHEIIQKSYLIKLGLLEKKLLN